MIPSPSVKIKIIGGKIYSKYVIGQNICLRCKGKILLGDINKLFVFKSLLIMPSNVLPLLLIMQTFPPIIWIFIEGKGDGIETRLPFKIFSTLILLFNFQIHIFKEFRNVDRNHKNKLVLCDFKKVLIPFVTCFYNSSGS